MGYTTIKWPIDCSPGKHSISTASLESMMGATIEWTQGIIRAGSSHHKYGDPYEFSACVIMLNKTAYVLGAVGESAMGSFRDLEAAIVGAGAEKIVWWRIKDGKQTRRERQISHISDSDKAL